MASSCFLGSSSPIGSHTTHDDTRLPSWPRSSSERTDTGDETLNSRLEGSTPRSRRYSRTAPVTTVSTTSLMVQPQALRTALSSSSGTSIQSKARWGPTSPLSGRLVGRHAHAEHLGDGAHPHLELGLHVLGLLHEAAEAPDGAEGQRRAAGHLVAPEIEAARRPPRNEGRRLGQLGDLGREREQDVGEVDARGAVDRAVVDLGDEREALAVVETLDHPGLPERPLAVEGLGHDPRRELLELLGRARRGRAVCRTS
ncbi:MAG: hypothetical protein QNK04_07705 [Myxococcota bacterium]|nr:hypothetical protein [Myxococcota bacterium]